MNRNAGFRRHPGPPPPLTRTVRNSLLDYEVEELVISYTGNWPSDELLGGVSGLIIGSVHTVV